MGADSIVLDESFNPGFLFTWKGIRTESEKNYHKHDYLELCYIMSGRGGHRIDGHVHEVQEGDLILINAGEYHQALFVEGSGPTVEFYVGLTNICLEGQAKNCLPVSEEEHVMHASGELKMKLSRLCISMDAEKELCRFGRHFMMKSYAVQMLLLFLRGQEKPRKTYEMQCSFDSFNRKYLVEKIMDYLEDNYARKISLDEIAGNMYLSPFYISKVFKAETGESPIHFLIEIRLEKARELLLSNPGLSIQEVASRVGYDDAYHFSKLFKKKFGETPSGLRRGPSGIPLQKLRLDRKLEEELILFLSEHAERITFLSGELWNHPDCLETESDMMRLAVLVKCLETTRLLYKRLKISEDIFYDTMSDIRIWCENSHNKGLENYQWLAAHIRGELFRIGRLQYQLYTCDNETLDYSHLPFDAGEPVVYIHIPQGEKLVYEDCVDSIHKAERFLQTFFPDYQYRYFFCESWLLFEGNAAFMRRDSNILRFASLFDHAFSECDDKQAIGRIFGARKMNPEDYPENTSLQKAAKAYLLAGHKLGIGVGTIPHITQEVSS